MVFDSVIADLKGKQDCISEILTFQGEFHQDLINRLLDQMNERVLSSGDEKKIASKVYSVLYELLNNILTHAEPLKQTKGIGFVHVQKNDLEYVINSGNLVNSNEVDRLISLVEDVNSMSTHLLDEEHAKRIKQGLNDGKVGEGLGFVQLRKMLDEPLQIRFTDFSEHLVVYAVTCIVNRK